VPKSGTMTCNQRHLVA